LKQLIILSSEFPYARGETFLQNEFPFLKSAFSSITIITETDARASRIKIDKTKTFSINKPGILKRVSFIFGVLERESMHLLLVKLR
jgi:hypothetical protein